MKRPMLLVAGFIILIASGCTRETIPSDCPEGTPGMSFAADIQSIFDGGCNVSACHGGGVLPDLSSGWAFDELTDGGYLDNPMDSPCETALYQVFQGTHGDRATEEEILKILGWIQEGAQNN